jgi:beta-1,4-mannosyltransferase
MDVVFAPDWRKGVPYQRLLAEALGRAKVKVRFLSEYKRVMPLKRLLASRPPDIFHLHWPEAYFAKKNDGFDWFRRMRFVWDLKGATRRARLVMTGHNLLPHNRAEEPYAGRNMRAAYQRAKVVFAHSPVAKERLVQMFELDPERVIVIPHGDLSVTLKTPISQEEARATLGLKTGKLALMFGTIEPYKGQEEVIQWWRQTRPDVTLAIVGEPCSSEYQGQIARAIGETPRMITRFSRVPDDQLRLWLSAADVTIFNYLSIFTSGAANLARSWGLPQLLPKRLDTVVLDEPSPFVHRFQDFGEEFGQQLQVALAVRPDFTAAAAWRESCNWDRVAQLTLDGYQRAMAK